MLKKRLSAALVVYGLLIAAIVFSAKNSGAQPGVTKLVIGKTFNNQQDCEITDALSLPISFPASTTQVAYQLVVDPNQVRSVQISLRGDSLDGVIQTVGCNKYGVFLGVVKQYQWGATISRGGGLAFKAGSYVLKFTVDGNSVEVPFTVDAQPTDVQAGNTVPREFSLSQNYPNPFNPSTTIRFVLPRAARVTLRVSNVLGQELSRLVDNNLPAGEHAVRWHAGQFAAGVYYYRLETDGFSATRKLLLLK